MYQYIGKTGYNYCIVEKKTGEMKALPEESIVVLLLNGEEIEGLKVEHSKIWVDTKINARYSVKPYVFMQWLTTERTLVKVYNKALEKMEVLTNSELIEIAMDDLIANAKLSGGKLETLG